MDQADWVTIDTAPRNGRIIVVRRVYRRRVIYEGPAVWRTVTFPPIPPHPLTGDNRFGEAYVVTGWMLPDQDKAVPTPTHWHPNQS